MLFLKIAYIINEKGRLFMIERLQNITTKYQELVEELTHDDVLQDYNKLRKSRLRRDSFKI